MPGVGDISLPCLGTCGLQTPGSMDETKNTEKTAEEQPEDCTRTSVGERINADFRTVLFAEATADELYTTEQIAIMLETHFGFRLLRIMITECLKDAGFESRLIGDQYYWALRRK